MGEIQYDPACVRCRIDAGKDIAGTTWQCVGHIIAERDSLRADLAVAEKERDEARNRLNVRGLSCTPDLDLMRLTSERDAALRRAEAAERDRDSEARWAKEYHDKWQAELARHPERCTAEAKCEPCKSEARALAALEAAEKRLVEWQVAVDHVMEPGTTKQDVTSSDGWTLMRSSRATDLAVAEERLGMVEKELAEAKDAELDAALAEGERALGKLASGWDRIDIANAMRRILPFGAAYRLGRVRGQRAEARLAEAVGVLRDLTSEPDELEYPLMDVYRGGPITNGGAALWTEGGLYGRVGKSAARTLLAWHARARAFLAALPPPPPAEKGEEP